MPSSTPSSSGSPRPSAMRSSNPPAPPFAWRANAVLFVLTVASVFFTGAYHDDRSLFAPESIKEGVQFAGALLSILLAHEFGHYIAARIHKVDATLPFFIPMPLSPFGTMGAVIRMRGVIPTRAALLDIGAAGPLAGLALAVPMYLWGAAHSTVVAPTSAEGSVQLGESLLIRVMDRLVAPQVPAGMDLMYSPVAYAAWAGLFVTMINLIPVAQLDGGHIAYALFGSRQNRIGQLVHRAMLVFFFVSLGSFIVRDVRGGIGLYRIGTHVFNSMFWLVWFEILAVLGAVSGKRRAPDDEEHHPLGVRERIFGVIALATLASVGRDKHSALLWGAWFVGLAVLLAMEARWGVLKTPSVLDHPPTGGERLGFVRAAIAILSLVLFALLFMPTPFAL